MCERGLKAILLSIHKSPSPVPFDCPEHEFDEGGGRFLKISVANGKCIFGTENVTKPRKTHLESSTAKEETTQEKDNEEVIDMDARIREEEERAENEIVISDGNIETPNAKDELKTKTQKIFQHLMSSIPLLYDLPVLHLKVHFIETEGVLVLQDDCECRTSSQTLMHNDDDIEGKFTEFFAEEINEKIDFSRCVLKEKDCGPPDYKVPLNLVLLYKAERAFPKANHGRLLLMVNARMKDKMDKYGLCCIRCWHQISGSEYLAHCSTRVTPEMSTLPPRTFQPLVPAELSDKNKYPVGMTRTMNAPFNFALNIAKSPYRAPVPEARKPTLSIRSKLPEDTGKRPEWVSRLIKPVPYAEERNCSAGISKGCKKPKAAVLKVAEIKESDGAKSRAKRHYEKPPFDISKLDAKRKRKLHSSNEEHYYRFSPTERFGEVV